MLFYGTRLCLVALPYVWFVGGVWVWLLSNDVVSQIVLIFSFTEDMCVKLIHSDAVLNHHYSNRLLKNWPPCWTSSLLAVQWRKNINFGSQKFTWDTGLRLVITWEKLLSKTLCQIFAKAIISHHCSIELLVNLTSNMVGLAAQNYIISLELMRHHFEYTSHTYLLYKTFT